MAKNTRPDRAKIKTGGWEPIVLTFPLKTFRPGWKGLKDHFLALLRRREAPFFLTDMKLSCTIKGPKGSTIEVSAFQMEKSQ